MKIKIILLGIFTLPHVFLYLLSKNKETIKIDIERWTECTQIPLKSIRGGRKIAHIKSLVYLLLSTPEYRYVFYLRTGKMSTVLQYLPREKTLYINTKSENFRAGTFIQHGFSTIIPAEHIETNSWINQQVTIGYNDSKTKGLGRPWIGNNVRFSAGAKVCDPVKIGNNCIIGMNAVVVKDVPENNVIIPSPTIILYDNGARVNKKL